MWYHTSFDPIITLLLVSLTLCLLFAKINQRASVSSPLAIQRDMGSSSLSRPAVINVHWLALLEVCFLYSETHKREKAFITDTTICITRNCHFPRKWMGQGWNEGGVLHAPDLQRELLDCCWPWLLSPLRDGQWGMGKGERSRKLWPSRCSVNQASVSSLWTSPLFMLRWRGAVVLLLVHCFNGVWGV